MDSFNCYQDPKRADSYAKLEFPGTYYLAFRDIPKIIAAHTPGKSALDFGCGTGRSTRFLRRFGLDAVGVDISPQMIAKANELDPQGDYRLIADGDFAQFANNRFDLIFSAFTFDNIPGAGNGNNSAPVFGRDITAAGISRTSHNSGSESSGCQTQPEALATCRRLPPDTQWLRVNK